MKGEKPELLLYLKKEAKSTKILLDYIGKRIDAINKKFTIRPVYVTSANTAAVKQRGVTRTPTLLYGKQKYETLEKIVKVITPPADAKERYGFSNHSPEELVHSYLDGVMNTKDDDDDDPMSNRDDYLRQRMAAFQKRRPEMQGVSKGSMLKGGRKVTAKKRAPDSFKDDNEFQELAGVNNLQSTPVDQYTSDMDGDALLEEYYNQLADASGRKPNTKRIRWSS